MKIRITKVPRDPNIEAYGGPLETKNKDTREYSFFPRASMYDLGGVLQAAGSNWGNVSETQTSVPNKGYNVGDVIEIDEAEAQLLKKLGYEYKIVG